MYLCTVCDIMVIMLQTLRVIVADGIVYVQYCIFI